MGISFTSPVLFCNPVGEQNYIQILIDKKNKSPQNTRISLKKLLHNLYSLVSAKKEM